MRDIVLTIIIFAALPICFVRPWIGILVWSWLGFMNPHKLTWDFARGMPFAMLIAIVTLAGLLLARDRKNIPWTRETVILLLLALYFTMTSYFAWVPEVAWHQWDKVMKIYLMTFVMGMLIYGRERIHALLMVVALSIGFYGLKGGIFTLTTGGAHHVLGPEGTFIEGNTFLGLAMIMVLPLLVFLGREEQRPWLRKSLYVIAGFTVISIIFTYSRGALLGLVAIVPFLFLRTKKKALAVFVLLPIAYIGMHFIPEQLYKRAETIQTYDQDRSAMQRLQAWSVAWNLAKARPFTGGGFDFENDRSGRWLSYADRKYDAFGQSARAAHSIYFQVLGQHGFVAFGLFMAMILFSLATLGRLRKQTQHDPNVAWISNYATALQVGLIGYLVAGAFLSSAYFDLLYTYVAITVILHREAMSYEKAKQGEAAQGKRRTVVRGIPPRRGLARGESGA